MSSHTSPLFDFGGGGAMNEVWPPTWGIRKRGLSKAGARGTTLTSARNTEELYSVFHQEGADLSYGRGIHRISHKFSQSLAPGLVPAVLAGQDTFQSPQSGNNLAKQ